MEKWKHSNKLRYLTAYILFFFTFLYAQGIASADSSTNTGTSTNTESNSKISSIESWHKCNKKCIHDYSISYKLQKSCQHNNCGDKPKN